MENVYITVCQIILKTIHTKLCHNLLGFVEAVKDILLCFLVHSVDLYCANSINFLEKLYGHFLQKYEVLWNAFQAYNTAKHEHIELMIW